MEYSVTKVSIMDSQNDTKIKKIHATTHFSCYTYIVAHILDPLQTR